MPCHEDKVKDSAAHTHHPAGSEGNKCISCHMPMTAFARMNRSDHSMLPPAPSATMAYKSLNACTVCHTDKDAAWADRYVREWRPRDYQAPVLKRAALIDGARKRDWTKLTEMLAYIKDLSTMRYLPHRSSGSFPDAGPKGRRRLAHCCQGPVAPCARRGCPGAGADTGHGEPAGSGRGDGRRLPPGEGQGGGGDRCLPADDCAACISGAAHEGE